LCFCEKAAPPEPKPVHCSCTSPRQGTVDKNGYTCSDGTKSWCAEWEECFSDAPFAFGKWTDGCRKAAPPPKPVGFCFDLEPPGTWGGATCATIAASVKSNPDDNYCKNRDNTSAKIWNQVKCAKSCDGCKWTTTWDWEPPSTWGGATCATIAASIKSNPDDNYCRNRGHSGKPWNDVYCAKTCIGIEAKPPDRRGQNCGPGCDWKGKSSSAKGGICDWCGVHKGQKMACCRTGYSDPGCAGAEGEHQWFHSCVTLSGSVVKTSSAEESPEEPSGSGGPSRPLTFVAVVIVSFILGLV